MIQVKGASSISMTSFEGGDLVKISYSVLLLTLCLFVSFFLVFFFKMKKQIRLLENILYVDPITGGYNDNKFREVASKLLKDSSGTYAIGCVNINNFRYINDMYGIECGNRVLADMFKKINDIVQDEGCYARVIADHFEFIVKYFDRETFIYVLKTYLSNIEANINDTDKVALKCSCGLYFIEDNNEKISHMLDKADIAIKSISEANSSEISVYDDKYANVLARNQKYTLSMEKALKDNEFKVYVQPKIDLITEKCIGGEALVRWISPSMGFISPGEFIPLFEKNGFVTEIDMFVLEQICKNISERLSENKPVVTISVNQSRLHLNNKYYVNNIEEIINKYNIPAQYIELELTENSFLDITYEIIGIINRLRRQGFSVSIDDFGSGYSSLNILKDISFDVLKIDQIFLNATDNNDRSASIIKSVIDMAHEIDEKVVCEGVETKEQVELLRKLGCDIVQGYYYAKPMPLEEFNAYLDSH